MNNNQVKTFALAALASFICIVVVSFHIIYWADMVASYSNYLVSMLFAPVFLALTLGYVSTLSMPMSGKSKLFVLLTPVVCTLVLVLLVYFKLQYGTVQL